jgi:hypothetical protein
MQRSSSSPHILRCRSSRHFRVSGIGSSCTPHLEHPSAEILKSTVYSSAKSDGQLPSYDLWCRSSWVFGFSGVHVSRFPHSCAIKKGFKPCAHSLDLMVTRVHLPSRTDPKVLTLLVWRPISPWP